MHKVGAKGLLGAKVSAKVKGQSEGGVEGVDKDQRDNTGINVNGRQWLSLQPHN